MRPLAGEPAAAKPGIAVIPGQRQSAITGTRTSAQEHADSSIICT